MNELSYDQLLRVETNHPISCPEINILKFTGNFCTKVYKVDIKYNPKDLFISINNLILSIEGLNNWSNGILDIYKKLPKNIVKDIDFDIENINKNLNLNYSPYLFEMENSINNKINEWIIVRDEYLLANKNIHIKNKELSSLEGFNNNLKNEILITILRKDIELLNDISNNLVEDFNKTIYLEFSLEVECFSQLLELVRERNDNLRMSVVKLKNEIINNAKEYLKLYQPMEYLDKIRPEVDRELNIGVLFNDIEEQYRNKKKSFYDKLNVIERKSGIDSIEKVKLISAYNFKSKEELLSEIILAIKIKGFEKVRYYLTADDFINNKDSYIELSLMKKNKNKISF